MVGVFIVDSLNSFQYISLRWLFEGVLTYTIVYDIPLPDDWSYL